MRGAVTDRKPIPFEDAVRKVMSAPKPKKKPKPKKGKADKSEK